VPTGWPLQALSRPQASHVPTKRATSEVASAATPCPARASVPGLPLPRGPPAAHAEPGPCAWPRGLGAERVARGEVGRGALWVEEAGACGECGGRGRRSYHPTAARSPLSSCTSCCANPYTSHPAPASEPCCAPCARAPSAPLPPLPLLCCFPPCPSAPSPLLPFVMYGRRGSWPYPAWRPCRARPEAAACPWLALAALASSCWCCCRSREAENCAPLTAAARRERRGGPLRPAPAEHKADDCIEPLVIQSPRGHRLEAPLVRPLHEVQPGAALGQAQDVGGAQVGQGAHLRHQHRGQQPRAQPQGVIQPVQLLAPLLEIRMARRRDALRQRNLRQLRKTQGLPRRRGLGAWRCAPRATWAPCRGSRPTCPKSRSSALAGLPKAFMCVRLEQLQGLELLDGRKGASQGASHAASRCGNGRGLETRVPPSPLGAETPAQGGLKEGFPLETEAEGGMATEVLRTGEQPARETVADRMARTRPGAYPQGSAGPPSLARALPGTPPFLLSLHPLPLGTPCSQKAIRPRPGGQGGGRLAARGPTEEALLQMGRPSVAGPPLGGQNGGGRGGC